VRALVTSTLDRWGRIDTLVSNAPVPSTGTSWVERTSLDEMTASLVGNVTNNLLLAQLVAPTMRAQGGGSIIYISSSGGIVAFEDHLAHSVANAGLAHMTRVLAVQLGPHNVRVNAVSPGVIASRGIDASAWADDELRRVVTGDTPLQRVGTADEIAGCVVWLASPSGGFATGQNFVIDGGQTLKGMDGPHRAIELARARRRGDSAEG
jgi:NAD(P)-dependent dehydrogenase (short-subunit alcohol dehydrogenase family)